MFKHLYRHYLTPCPWMILQTVGVHGFQCHFIPNCNSFYVLVGDGSTILVIKKWHSNLPSDSHRPLHLNKFFVTLQIVKNRIYVHRFTRDNKYYIRFEEFSFSWKIIELANSSTNVTIVENSAKSPPPLIKLVLLVDLCFGIKDSIISATQFFSICYWVIQFDAIIICLMLFVDHVS